jgi:hypothetical protein
MLWNNYVPTASASCGVNTEPSGIKCCIDPGRTCSIILIFPVSCQPHGWYGGCRWDKCPHGVGCSDWLSVPYGQISYTFYTCCDFQFPKFCLHPSLPYDHIHRHVELIVIFLEDPLWDCACVHGTARLEACLFRQCRSCHVQRECYSRIVPSVADLFPAWYSWVNPEECV